jgi:hypothetical protein
VAQQNEMHCSSICKIQSIQYHSSFCQRQDGPQETGPYRVFVCATLKHVLLFLEITRQKDKGLPGGEAKSLIKDIKSFSFMFYIKLMSTLFSETAVLHESLQHAELDIVTAKNNAETCVEKLRALQSSENDFDDFFDTVVQMAN